MAASFHDFVPYSRFNLSESESDIHYLIREYRERVVTQMIEKTAKNRFISFAETKLSLNDVAWQEDNDERFFKDTENVYLYKHYYLAQCGFITCMCYSEGGQHIIVGHSSGLVQLRHGVTGAVLCTLRAIQFPPKPIYALQFNKTGDVCYASCMDGAVYKIEIPPTATSATDPPQYCIRVDPALECLTMQFYGSPGISGHATPFITQRSPALSLGQSADETKMVVGYADTSIKVYDMETQETATSATDPPQYCIRVDPALECLTMQFYGSPGISGHATPFITQRSPALSLGQSADETKMVVGYADTSIKVYDMETQEVNITYKVHKLRLQFIPKKLQRMHFGQVCALKCHPVYPYMFASGSWDKTLRIWDLRCKVGCVMTFEGVDICSNSIDLNRNHCVAGSWRPTEALTVWDLVAKKRLSVVSVQNRRPDVDGEYIYACRYWRSNNYNRKGKYAIIGGSGTNCVEVINLHNRYITCSYPADGTVLAVTSHGDKIAFGGTATTFNIVQLHDPKHERDKYHKDDGEEFDCTKALFVATSSERLIASSFTDVEKKMSTPSARLSKVAK